MSVALATSGSTINHAHAPWPQNDLARRTVAALELARHVVGTVVESRTEAESNEGLLRPKIVAETAMLLVCVAPVSHVDERIPQLLAEIASALIPHARSQTVLSSICMDPGLAMDHAAAHLLLSHLGYPDPTVDRLLASAFALGPDFGPERVHHRRLEREWLQRIWPITNLPSAPDSLGRSRLLAESMLGRPLDALGLSRLDAYALTHSIMYASDLGTRPVTLPRRRADIAADAIASLAFSLESDDFDLTAEVLLTWPMLGLAWSPSASFAFRVLADLQDELGFVPGLGFDRSHFERLQPNERPRYVLKTSYHTIYVMGFLSAAALLPGRAPAASVPQSRGSHLNLSELLRLFGRDGGGPRWRQNFQGLSIRQQRSLGPLLLAMQLRRAHAKGDLGLVRECLAISLRHNLLVEPIVRQAVALLRRGEVLTELASRWPGTSGGKRPRVSPTGAIR